VTTQATSGAQTVVPIQELTCVSTKPASFDFGNEFPDKEQKTSEQRFPCCFVSCDKKPLNKKSMIYKPMGFCDKKHLDNYECSKKYIICLRMLLQKGELLLLMHVVLVYIFGEMDLFVQC
jgi:hypothetical protein